MHVLPKCECKFINVIKYLLYMHCLSTLLLLLYTTSIASTLHVLSLYTTSIASLLFKYCLSTLQVIFFYTTCIASLHYIYCLSTQHHVLLLYTTFIASLHYKHCLFHVFTLDVLHYIYSVLPLYTTCIALYTTFMI